MTQRVEPMSQAAAEPVSLLHRDCFPGDPWDFGAIDQIMRMPGFFGRIGWAQDDPVGFALALALGVEAEILSLGVVLRHRRAGMGSALLVSIRSEARRRGAQCLVLEVAADNEAARALYAAQGFTVVGCRRNYYRRRGRFADALILRASLITPSPTT